MYIDAYGLLQEDGQDQMAFASHQNTASIYIKLSRMDSFFKSDLTQCVVQLLSVEKARWNEACCQHKLLVSFPTL
ncbi:unnamed protein product, partial [Sphagnum compactum]